MSRCSDEHIVNLDVSTARHRARRRGARPAFALFALVLAVAAVLAAPLLSPLSSSWLGALVGAPSNDAPAGRLTAEGTIGGFTASAQRGDARQLVIYSGRSEAAIRSYLQRFIEETGIDVVVRYGDTAQVAATILEEGRRSPADVFFAQDAGALGSLSEAGLLMTLPDELLEQVDPRFRSPLGHWIGTSGRARVLVHNTELVPVDEAPTSIWALVEPEWRGRIGWAPTNGSFQAFVTALRMLEGEDRAAQWLRAVQANNPRVYPNNRAIVDAVLRGEIAIGLVNHYYLFQFINQYGAELPARNHFTKGDAGAIINVAGAGILESSTKKDLALQFIEFLLSETSQQQFTDSNFEYPVLVSGNVRINEMLPPLQDLDVPDLDLSNLRDLEGTLELLQKVGIL